MKIALVILLTFSSSLAFSKNQFVQTNQSKKQSASRVLRLFKGPMTEVVCISKDEKKQKLILRKGMNAQDGAGLVITGDFAYGTNEIRQINVYDDLLINFGEEGNYTLVIRSFASDLFGVYDDSDKPQVGDDPIDGIIINEDGKVTSLECIGNNP